MNLIRRKLKSEDGASLMLALLFFVICAMVGSVILAAASTAAGRVAGLKTSDQAKYTLESAAKLLQANISGWTYERKCTIAQLGKEGAPEGVLLKQDGGADATALNRIAPFLKTCRTVNDDRWGENLLSGTPTYGMYGINPLVITSSLNGKTDKSKHSFNYLLQLSGSDHNIDPVIANLVMNCDFTIYIDLYIAKKNADNKFVVDPSMPNLMMTFNADFTEQFDTELNGAVQQDTSYVRVAWDVPVTIFNEKITGITVE